MLDKLASGPKIGQDLARVGSGVARGANRAKLMQGAAWTDTWPAPGSTLDLDFANDRGWVRGFGQGGVMDALTYTRASSATFVGPDGLLKGSGSSAGALGKNLLSFPQDFDNAAWAKTSNMSIATKADVAPDGTFTASLYTNETTISGLLRQSFNTQTQIDQTKLYTFSAYAKSGTTSVLFLSFDGTQQATNAWFDLETETIQTQDVEDATIENVGDGWYRCSITLYPVPTDVSVFPRINIRNTIGSGVVSAGQTMLIWGAQFEEGTTATEYFPTNVNVPRFDWGSTDQISEKNFLTFTEQFENDVWLKENIDVIPNAAIAPNGQQTADLLRPTASTDRHRVRHSINAPTNSFINRGIYVKSAGYKYIGLLRNIGDSGVNLTVFDITTATKVSQGVDADYGQSTIEELDDGWCRITIRMTTGTQIAGLQPQMHILPDDIVLPITSSQSATYTTDGINGIYFWGAQEDPPDLEELLPYQEVGSHIPSSTPLSATPTVNGILIEETRTNNLLWCRDLTQSYSPTNKNWFQHSNDFTNTIWNFDGNQARISRTTGFADPFGGSDATRIQPNSGRTAANAYFGQRARTLYPATFSVYMKAAEYDYGVLSLFSYAAGNFAVFDLSAGTIFTAPTVAGLTADIESVGDGWYRCSLTVAVPERQRGFWISTSPDGATNTAANGTSGILIYGAQAENGLTATTYEDVADLPVALWTHDNVTVAKDQTGIDGVAGAASSVTADADNAEIKQISLLAAAAHTSSVFLKRITGSGVVQVSLDGVTYSTVDLSHTEWRRIALSGTVTNPALSIRLATSGDVIAVDYGQVESGGFVTSPILTTSSIISRAADFITQRGGRVADWLMLNSEGIFAIDFTITSIFPASIDSWVAGLGITTNNNLWFEIVRYRHNGTALIPSNLNVFSGARNTVARAYLPRNGQQKSESAYTNTLISTVPVTISTGDNPWNIFGIGNNGRVFFSGTSGAMTIKRIFYIPCKSNGTILKELENNIL